MGVSRLSGSSGMTLPEVVIATMVLAMTLSAFITGFLMNHRTILHSNNRLAAMHEARAVLEDLGANNYDSSALSAGTHSLSNGNYTVEEDANIKNVVVTIQWMDPGRRVESTAQYMTSFCRAVHK